jgi:hypothetical protein
MTQPTARRGEIETNSILKQQNKTKIQKSGPSPKPPEDTKTKSKRKNDKQTQKPKRDQSQKPAFTQPYRTKTHHLARSKNVSNINKFWLTSCSSSEFGQNYPSYQPALRQKPNSQINFPHDCDSNTMPKPKIELIRLQQEAVVNNLLTIARYTNTKPVYTEMTHDEFKKTMRNLDHISTICTRSIRACRHGQNLAPKVGPLSHYYRLFEDFGEILHLESDKILTLKEYLLDHEYRLVITPPKPPKITGLRNLLQHYSDESEDETSPSTPRYSPRRASDDSDTSDDSESDSDSEPDNALMSTNPKHDGEYDSDVELIF